MGLGTVELVLDIEDHFGIKIPDAGAESCETIGDVADVVWRLLNDGGDAGMTRPRMERRLKLVVARSVGLPYARCSLPARFIGDLGVD